MSEYENPRAVKEAKVHPDVDRNVNYFYRLMAKTELVSAAFYEISDRHDGQVKEYKSVTFVWKIKDRWHSCPISFSQSHKDFKKELCNSLNYWSHEGYLRRLDRPIDDL